MSTYRLTPADTYIFSPRGSGNVVTLMADSGKTLVVNNGTAPIVNVTPGAPDTSVQFNNNGAFGGEAAFTYEADNDLLVVSNIDSIGTITAANITDGTFSVNGGVFESVSMTSGSNDVACKSLFNLTGDIIPINVTDPVDGNVLVYKNSGVAEWQMPSANIDGTVVNDVTINNGVLRTNISSESLGQQVAASKSFCLWANLTDAPSQGVSCSMGLTNDLTTYRVVSGCPNNLGGLTPSLGGCAVFSSTNGGTSFVNDVLLKNTSVTLQGYFGQNSAISSTATLLSFNDGSTNDNVYLYHLNSGTWTFRLRVPGGVVSKPSVLKFIVGGGFGMVNIYQTSDFVTWTLQQNISRTYSGTVRMVDFIGGEMACYVCPDNNVVHIYNTGGGGTFLHTGMFPPFPGEGTIISMSTSGEYTVYCTASRLYIVKRTGITNHAFTQSFAIANCKSCVMAANGQTRINVTTTTDIITFNRDPVSQEFIQASVLDLGPTMTSPKLCAAGALVGVGSTQYPSNGGVQVYGFSTLTGATYVDNDIHVDTSSTMYSLYTNNISGDTIVKDGNLSVSNGKLLTFPQSGLMSLIANGTQSLTTSVSTNLSNQMWGVSGAICILTNKIVPSQDMSTFTVAESGVYSLSINVGFATNGTGARNIGIKRNSTSIAYNNKISLAGGVTYVATSATVALAVGDILTFEVMQASGGTLLTSFGNLSVNKIANI